MKTITRAWTRRDYGFLIIIMGLMGAYYWAIRGTGGYGGETGGMLAGLGWALLWYGFSGIGAEAERRPYGHPWALFAITCGIAMGGFTGYGVYTAWVRGDFYLNYPEMHRDVPAWTGYAMLFLCGLHWGGNAGAFLAWCAPQKPLRAMDWALRIACGVGGAIAASVFVRACPQLFLPYYAEGLYSVPEYKTCVRALDSIHTIAPHVGLALGFLTYEILRRDWRAVGMILTVGLGFAIPFAAGGYWHTLHDLPIKLGWWKNWEMTIGLGGGIAFGLAFWLFNQPGKTQQHKLGPKSEKFFLSGFPLWLPLNSVLSGLYSGLWELHGARPTTLGHIVVLLISAAPFAWLWWRGKSGLPDVDRRFALSFKGMLWLQALIIVSGYLVSIPMAWKLANVVLVLLYTGYIGVSIALGWLLAIEPAPKRQRGA